MSYLKRISNGLRNSLHEYSKLGLEHLYERDIAFTGGVKLALQKKRDIFVPDLQTAIEYENRAVFLRLSKLLISGNDAYTAYYILSQMLLYGLYEWMTDYRGFRDYSTALFADALRLRDVNIIGYMLSLECSISKQAIIDACDWVPCRSNYLGFVPGFANTDEEQAWINETRDEMFQILLPLSKKYPACFAKDVFDTEPIIYGH